MSDRRGYVDTTLGRMRESGANMIMDAVEMPRVVLYKWC